MRKRSDVCGERSSSFTGCDFECNGLSPTAAVSAGDLMVLNVPRNSNENWTAENVTGKIRPRSTAVRSCFLSYLTVRDNKLFLLLWVSNCAFSATPNPRSLSLSLWVKVNNVLLYRLLCAAKTQAECYGNVLVWRERALFQYLETLRRRRPVVYGGLRALITLLHDWKKIKTAVS